MKVLRLGTVQSGFSGEPQQIGLVRFVDVNDKIAALRELIAHGAQDPTVREVAMREILACGAPARDARAQAACLLRFAQENLYYAQEEGEVLQTARYTLTHGWGDCDDLVIALGAMLESILIPTKVEVMAWGDAKGDGWRHVYLRVVVPGGDPRGLAAEPTIKGAPLGMEPRDILARIT